MNEGSRRHKAGETKSVDGIFHDHAYSLLAAVTATTREEEVYSIFTYQ